MGKTGTPPAISVIIPVGPGHEYHVVQALESVRLQKIISAECIVMNDTPHPSVIGSPEGVSLLVVDRCRTSWRDRPWGVGLARNLGAFLARGRALMFLDADDILVPGSLAALWRAFEKAGGNAVVYGDVLRGDTHEVHKQAAQYCGDDLHKTALYNPKRMPTHLVPRWAHEAVGGWDERMALWEDIDYEIRMDAAGICAVHIDYPVYYYRFETGQRRKRGDEDVYKEEARHTLRQTWKEYYEGVKMMGCSSCGSKNRMVSPPPQRASAMLPNVPDLLQRGAELEIEFIYPTRSARYYIGPVTQRRYRFAMGSVERLRKVRVGTGADEVHPDNAPHMLSWASHGSRLFKLNILAAPEPEPDRNEVAEAKLQSRPVPPPSKRLDDVEAEALRQEVAAIFANRVEGGQGVYEEAAQPEAPVAEVQEEEPLDVDESPAPVSDFTISAMRNLVSHTPRSVLQAWLDEEQASDSPRVGMVSVLKGALDASG